MRQADVVQALLHVGVAVLRLATAVPTLVEDLAAWIQLVLELLRSNELEERHKLRYLPLLLKEP
jgi:hypothetical protein